MDKSTKQASAITLIILGLLITIVFLGEIYPGIYTVIYAIMYLGLFVGFGYALRRDLIRRKKLKEK